MTLTAIAETGYVFVGWIGCKHTGPTTCEVDVTAATEVSAVFLKEGKEGPRGPEGPTGSNGAGVTLGVILPGEHGCANGGTEVVSSLTTTFICDGTNGSNGSNGSNGAAGGQGSVGPAGPAGAQGPDGPAGKVQLVTCKTVKIGKKKMQQCTTKLVSGAVKFTTSGKVAHATLSRHGEVFATGMAVTVNGGHLSLWLAPPRKLRPGHYTLTLISGTDSPLHIRRESFTLS